MDPATYDLSIHAGTADGWVFTVKESGTVVDLTGFTVAAQVRDRNGTLVLDLAPSITDAAGGQIAISLASTVTAGLAAGRYFWDLVINDGDDWQGPYLAGAVTVTGTQTET